MGLFGAIYTAFVLGARGYKEVKESIKDSNDREKAKREGKEVYIGDDGVGRYTDDGRKTMYCYEHLNGYNEKPDYVLKYVGTDEIIRNFSQEDRDRTQRESLKEAAQKGYTVYRIGEKNDNHFHDKCKGFRYKDVKTGDIYVIRKVNGACYYMNVNTGLLVRKTDRQIDVEKYDAANNSIRHKLNQKRDAEHLVEKFNEQQLEYAQKYGINFRNDLLAYE